MVQQLRDISVARREGSRDRKTRRRGPIAEQESHDVGVASRGGPCERSPAPKVRRIDGKSVLVSNEHPDALDPAELARVG